MQFFIRHTNLTNFLLYKQKELPSKKINNLSIFLFLRISLILIFYFTEQILSLLNLK